MVCYDCNRHQKSMEVGSGGQCPLGGRPHNPATWFHPTTTTVVSPEPFPHQSRALHYRHWSVLLWWDPNDVQHRRILPSYQAERWSVPASLCWWCCYCLADQLWVLVAYAWRRRIDWLMKQLAVLSRVLYCRCALSWHVLLKSRPIFICMIYSVFLAKIYDACIVEKNRKIYNITSSMFFTAKIPHTFTVWHCCHLILKIQHRFSFICCDTGRSEISRPGSDVERRWCLVRRHSVSATRRCQQTCHSADFIWSESWFWHKLGNLSHILSK